MKSGLLSMCNECKAIKINEKPEIWMGYNILTGWLYNKFSEECRGIGYCNCPRCSGRLRRMVGR